MNLFSLIIVAGMVLWLVPPLRRLVVQRTNLTVKALLVAFPVAYAGVLSYRFFWGERDDSTTVGFTVLALLLVWGALIGVGTVLERRRLAPRPAPPLATRGSLPGMPVRVGELGTAAMARAARQATIEGTATSTATSAVTAALPAAIRMATMANPIAGKLLEVAAPHAVRAVQAATPGAVRAMQAGAPGAMQAVQGAVQNVSRTVAQVDTTSVAMKAGRFTGRLYARARKSFVEGSTPQHRPTA